MKKPTRAPKQNKFKLPSALELAQLAAVLAPHAERGNQMNRAMERAMEYYHAAFYYHAALPTDRRQLIGMFGSHEQYVSRDHDLFQAAIDKSWSDTLRLEKSKDGYRADEVRCFLDDNGQGVQTARAVIDNIKEWCEWWRDDRTKRWGGQFTLNAEEILELLEIGNDVVNIPKHILKEVVAFKKKKHETRGGKGWETRQRNNGQTNSEKSTPPPSQDNVP